MNPRGNKTGQGDPEQTQEGGSSWHASLAVPGANIHGCSSGLLPAGTRYPEMVISGAALPDAPFL